MEIKKMKIINKRMAMKEEIKQKIAIAKKGIRVSPKTEFKKGCTPWNKGKTFPKLQGENSSGWKGGKSRSWSYKVLERSNKIKDQCQICKEKGKIQIHHIDGNKNNNQLKNLGVVCSYCHFAIHDNGKNTRFVEVKI